MKTIKSRAADQSRKFFEAFEHFVGEPASARPLAVLRILLGVALLLQSYFVAGDIFELYGKSGIMQDSLTRFLVSPHVPRMGWFVNALASWGVTEKQAILGTSIAYAASLVLMVLGLGTRAATVAVWFLHWTLMNSGYYTNYGADTFAHIMLFYLIWMPAGAEMSLDRALSGRPAEPSFAARLSLRVIQLHLCMMYVSSGIEKAMGPQWLNGEVMWRALMLPVYYQYDFSWLAGYPWLAKLGGWGTLLIEIGYPIFIWPKRTRALWVMLTLSLHIGIAIFLGLTVFGIVMSVLTLAAFGISSDAPSKEAPVLDPPMTEPARVLA